MTAKELIQRYNQGERDFSYASLPKAILCHANLSNANFSNANFSNANLAYANLTHSNFSGADIREANLSNADLNHSNLSNANLYEAYFPNANFKYANLSNANLTGANLRYAVGNGKEIISLTLKWWIVMTKDILTVGCQQYRTEEWRNFTDAEIEEMHSKALSWWKKYKRIIWAIHRTI